MSEKRKDQSTLELSTKKENCLVAADIAFTQFFRKYGEYFPKEGCLLPLPDLFFKCPQTSKEHPLLEKARAAEKDFSALCKKYNCKGYYLFGDSRKVSKTSRLTARDKKILSQMGNVLESGRVIELPFELAPITWSFDEILDASKKQAKREFKIWLNSHLEFWEEEGLEVNPDNVTWQEFLYHRRLYVAKKILAGYMGWLLVNSEFLGDLEEVKAAFEKHNVPCFLHGIVGWNDSPVHPEYEELIGPYIALCRKWFLASIESPLLPVPLDPQRNSFAHAGDKAALRNKLPDDYEFTSPAQILLEIMDKSLSSQAVIESSKERWPHLSGWFDKVSGYSPRIEKMLETHNRYFIWLNWREQFENRLQNTLKAAGINSPIGVFHQTVSGLLRSRATESGKSAGDPQKVSTKIQEEINSSRKKAALKTRVSLRETAYWPDVSKS